MIEPDAGCALRGDDAWRTVTPIGAPERRHYHTAVWTGSEMIVWGGLLAGTADVTDSGGRYDPVTNIWLATGTSGAPEARLNHTAVWTGSEMIVWGGVLPTKLALAGDGGRYNPATDSWTTMASDGAPEPRRFHVAVWTGSEMLVWGGEDLWYRSLGDGARYDPAGDRWMPMSEEGAPRARSYHTAVWTDSEMIVWAGAAVNFVVSDGARYDPVTDAWSPVTTVGAPEARAYHTAVWTGSEMIVWGGLAGSGSRVVSSGGRYDPDSDSWSPTTEVGAPAGRIRHGAVWSGTEMLVWGGDNDAELFGDGARYEPGSDSWVAMSSEGAPPPRHDFTAIWACPEFIVWGGVRGGGGMGGSRYAP
jgi:N-acetylneuraminic acid mutarotase